MDLPIVDLARTDSSDLARARAASAIDDALGRVGLMTIVHHGIHPRVVARAFDASRTFFDRPLDAKEAVAAEPGQAHGYGYARLGSDPPTVVDGDRTGVDVSETYSIHPGHDRRLEPNRWPAEIVGFRETLTDYLRATAALADRVMGLCALALGLDERYFVPHIDRAALTLRANHYSALTERRGQHQWRGGAHTDDGSIALLATDGVPRLDVRGPDGTWQPVSAPRGSFIVNVGDLLARWTNDRWRSTGHRVVPPAGAPPYARRLSLVLVQTPNEDAVIECLPTCVAPGRPARYGRITAGELLRAKLDALYAVQGERPAT